MEKFADSLIQLFQLIDEMAPDFESNPLSDGKKVSPTGIETARDFKRVYDRNLKDYQKRYPGASEAQFREYSIKSLSRRIEAIEKDIKGNDVVHWTEIYINDYLKADNRNEIKGIILKGIDIPALSEALCKKEYFVKDDLPKVQSWFEGVNPDNKINITKPMNHFCSLIAHLIEKNHISNTKEFCCNRICEYFLFNGNDAKIGSVKNVISRGKNRIPLLNIPQYRS